MPPWGPRSVYTGTPASLSASMSRYTVRIETSSSSASCPAVSWPRVWSMSRIESRRDARILPSCQNRTINVKLTFGTSANHEPAHEAVQGGRGIVRDTRVDRRGLDHGAARRDDPVEPFGLVEM